MGATYSSIYQGREAVCATKHRKEQIIGPRMAHLGLRMRVPLDLDTDALETFLGEVPRLGSPHEVVVRKARLGMVSTGLPLGLGNEGSFGADPAVPFVAGDHEILAFVDDELGIQVTEELFSSGTNFACQVVAGIDDCRDFLRHARFPSHGLIFRPNAGSPPWPLLAKGIASWTEFVDAVGRCAQASSDGLAHVETDMRAHVNPMRQRVIGILTERLARRLAARCPSCGAPGWGLVGVVRGLPCEVCGGATGWVREEIHGCPRSQFKETIPRSDGIRVANAAPCPWCNHQAVGRPDGHWLLSPGGGAGGICCRAGGPWNQELDEDMDVPVTQRS